MSSYEGQHWRLKIEACSVVRSGKLSRWRTRAAKLRTSTIAKICKRISCIVVRNRLLKFNNVIELEETHLLYLSYVLQDMILIYISFFLVSISRLRRLRDQIKILIQMHLHLVACFRGSQHSGANINTQKITTCCNTFIFGNDELLFKLVLVHAQ